MVLRFQGLLQLGERQAHGRGYHTTLQLVRFTYIDQKDILYANPMLATDMHLPDPSITLGVHLTHVGRLFGDGYQLAVGDDGVSGEVCSRFGPLPAKQAFGQWGRIGFMPEVQGYTGLRSRLDWAK